MQIGERENFSSVEKMNYTPVKEKKPTLHGEIQKIRTLGFDYFWHYYKWWAIGSLFLLIVSGAMARDIAKNKQPHLLVGAVYNCRVEGNIDVFGEKLAEYMGADLKKTPVKLLVNLECRPGGAYSEGNSLSEMKLEAQITSKELDFIIGDELLMKSLCIHTGDAFYLTDLREALPEELYRRLSHRIIWYKTAGGEAIPAVIEISESKIDEMLILEQAPVYLGMISNAQHAENVVRMLEYISSGDEQDN